MKQKLFNYFMTKVVQQEQSFLKSDDARLAALEVIFSKMSVHRQYASGASSETIYFCAPKYAEELFLILCMDAAAHGDNLARLFDFKPFASYLWGHRFEDVSDSELKNYLEKVYPINAAVDKELYQKLFTLPAEKINNILNRLSAVYIRDAHPELLENLPEPCAETAMIDRAWARLMGDKTFVELLKPNGKHCHNGYSRAYDRYSKTPDFLK